MADQRRSAGHAAAGAQGYRHGEKHHIPAVFSESTVSDKPARQVARETDTHYGGVLYVDSLSAENGPVPTYIDLLNVTTRTLVQGIRDGMKE